MRYMQRYAGETLPLRNNSEYMRVKKIVKCCAEIAVDSTLVMLEVSLEAKETRKKEDR